MKVFRWYLGKKIAQDEMRRRLPYLGTSSCVTETRARTSGLDEEEKGILMIPIPDNPFTFADDEAKAFWEEFRRLHQTGPDAEIVAYAAAFAAAMEVAIKREGPLEETWLRISNQVGSLYRMSGATEMMAFKLLRQTWVYGDALWTAYAAL